MLVLLAVVRLLVASCPPSAVFKKAELSGCYKLASSPPAVESEIFPVFLTL